MYEAASAKQKLSKEQVAKFEKTLMKGGSFDPKLQAKLNAVRPPLPGLTSARLFLVQVHSLTLPSHHRPMHTRRAGDPKRDGGRSEEAGVC